MNYHALTVSLKLDFLEELYKIVTTLIIYNTLSIIRALVTSKIWVNQKRKLVA